jgi:hypothetical protein
MMLLPEAGKAQRIHAKLENMLSGWATVNFADPVNYQFGGRYIPTLSVSDSLAKDRLLDVEISVNTYGNVLFTGDSYEDGNAVLKPYRLWLRYATPRLECRIGLQKINFGSATILRPMMWFDRMDFRDPLQLTDGVYAFLGRYYFRGNANIWLWMLYGNNETKGWELVPTHKSTPEFGGRFQLPVPRGEAAVSFHKRSAELTAVLDSTSGTLHAVYPENRIGIDGKWDLGVGLWFESVIKYSNLDQDLFNKWETYFNLGLDYTFGLGSGLHVTTEYFRYSNTARLTGEGLHNNFLALVTSYPLGILNTVSAMVYYNWEQHDWYRLISLQRIYDYWSFYLMAFWNPDRISLYHAENNKTLFAGKGIQIIAVVNF